MRRTARRGCARWRASPTPTRFVNVALKSEHTDAAVAALERVDGAEALSAIAQRARNKVAARRARTKLRQLEEAAQPPHEVAVPMSADDRQRALSLLHRAEALVDDGRSGRGDDRAGRRAAGVGRVAGRRRDRRGARAAVRRGERGRARGD